jgi:hypothetical protein
MRYFFRMKAVDLDMALAHYPSKRVELLKCATTGTDMQALRSWMGVPGTCSTSTASTGATRWTTATA